MHPMPPPISRWQRLAPVITLLLAAPLVSEVLYGATRLSVIFALVPQIATWGCGALLIRECVRRWHKGWPSMLLLALALAVAEECLIQQTSLAPLVGVAANAYGRIWGVNWVYFLWALGYESVWVALLPVQLTELLFSARQREPWLRAPGMVIGSIVFALGAFIAWYGWTQQARVQVFHLPPYSPPPLYLAIALASILLLFLAARAVPRESQAASRTAPSPWLVGVVICALGAPWAAFVLLGYGTFLLVPFPAILAGGLVWAALTFSLLRRWTSSPDWRPAHRFALVFGGVAACMLGGFVVFKVGGALRIDWIGKAVLNVAATAWLVSIWPTVRRRDAAC